MHTASWQVGYRGIVADGYLDGLDWRDRHREWAPRLADAAATNVATLVATHPGKGIVGFSTSGPTRDQDLSPLRCFELYAIYVLATSWGTGVGHELLAKVVAALPPQATVLTAWVLSANARGRRFYESAGFEPDGRTQVSDIGGYHLSQLRYRLNLTQVDPSKRATSDKSSSGENGFVR